MLNKFTSSRLLLMSKNNESLCSMKVMDIYSWCILQNVIRYTKQLTNLLKKSIYVGNCYCYGQAYYSDHKPDIALEVTSFIPAHDMLVNAVIFILFYCDLSACFYVNLFVFFFKYI